MPKYLVIVRSPAKAKQSKVHRRELRSEVASDGHVRDLPKIHKGIDIEANFEQSTVLRSVGR